ncbi:MAG TPA: class I SAM-dependent methyltransferase [Drouetiella sp.]|jgi:2-polyprenyl-3-methyl-5-hydroxy-6-metoxy-1,4-benzoquinol methylase
METGAYVGTELQLFARALRWKQYYRSLFSEYLRGDVLEVGAGLGGTAEVLCDGSQRSWLCLEPDQQMVNEIKQKVRNQTLPRCCDARAGITADIDSACRFDCILYIDVLEHISDHQSELAKVVTHLRPGGTLVIMSPAHQYLYTPFDKAIGHFRRYSAEDLATLVPKQLQQVSMRYLDCAGFFASLANRLLLKQSMPTESQILFWDRVLIPFSTVADRILSYRFGKSVLGIWKKTGA